MEKIDKIISEFRDNFVNNNDVMSGLVSFLFFIGIVSLVISTFKLMFKLFWPLLLIAASLYVYKNISIEHNWIRLERIVEYVLNTISDFFRLPVPVEN